MSKVALIIDNSAGMPQEDIDRLKVAKVIPISFMVNGEEYYENVNMSYSQFFEFLQDKNTNVSTSQPSIEFVKEAWREVLKDYDEAVYLLLSSGLSEACNAAVLASQDEEFAGRIYVVDNGGVSLLNKIPMFKARYMIDQGKSAKEIKEHLESVKKEADAYIAVDTLKYLKKGGRITPATAAIGTLLNIKPILRVAGGGGKLDSVAKVISFKLAKSKIVSLLKKSIEENFAEEYKNKQVYICVAHTMADLQSKELASFIEFIKQEFADAPFFSSDPLPLFVTCHTGPGALAAGFVVDRTGAIDAMMKN